MCFKKDCINVVYKCNPRLIDASIYLQGNQTIQVTGFKRASRRTLIPTFKP